LREICVTRVRATVEATHKSPPEIPMSELVTLTLQRIFARAVVPAGELGKAVALVVAERPRRPDFAETRPVIFRSEGFAEDLAIAA
jgi:hypothetical protein